MFTRYDIEDITFDEVDDIIEEAKKNTTPGAGGTTTSPTSTPTKTPTPAPSKRILEDHTEAMLRQMWRAGRLTEAEWKAELVARTGSEQVAADKIAYQKTVGVGTNGQLTASEARAVDALKSGPTAGQQTQQVAQGSQAVFDAARNAWNTATGYGGGTGGGGSITPPSLSGGAGLGPAGRTYDQITGTDYLSDAERDWYRSQTPSGGSSGSSSRASGSSGASSGSSSPAPPKAPLPNSAADLANRGAVRVGSTPVLEGTAYRRPNEVVQGDDGQWYIIDPAGNPVSGPYPNQTQANTANVYQASVPAITSNPYAAIGNAALAGAGRQRVAQGSGQNAAVKLDDIIGLTHQRGQDAGEFMGSTSAFGDPVDVLRGNVGIPDYGGMREVPGGGFTGRMLGDDGQEMAIGMSGIQQEGTQYGSHAQMAFSPWLTQSQIDRIDPARYDELMLRAATLRDQGQLQDASAKSVNNRGSWSADSAAANANYSLLTGEDPWGIETLPEPYADGGSFTVREPSVIKGLQTGTNYGVMGVAPERVSIDPLGTERQQQQANVYEQAIAQALGGQPMAQGARMQIGNRNMMARPTSPGIGLQRFRPPAPAVMPAPAPVAPRPQPPNPYADIGAYFDTGRGEDSVGNLLIDGPGGQGRLFAMPRYNEDGSFRGWLRRPMELDLAKIQAMFIDRAPRNGVDDRLEDDDPRTNPPAQAPSPTPNIYATGGQLNFQPQIPRTSRPSYLKALAEGINRNIKLRLPVAAV